MRCSKCILLPLTLAWIVLHPLSVHADPGGRLLNAVRPGNQPEVQRLLSDPEVLASIDHRNRRGQTSLYKAARLGEVNILRLLIQAGADINCTAEDDWTPLHSAISNGNLEATRVLVESGADLNRRMNTGQTPVYYAARKNRLGALQLLVERGADLDIAEEDGLTPLHSAALNNRAEAARILIDGGADVTLEDHRGRTAFALARIKSHQDVIAVFRETDSIPPKRYILTRVYELQNKSYAEDIRVRMTVPDLPAYRNVRVLSRNHSVEAREGISEPNGNRWLVYELDLSARDQTALRLEWHIELSYVNDTEASHATHLTIDQLTRYLAAEEKIEATHPLIAQKSEELTSGASTDLEKLERIISFVRSHITYGLQDSTTTTGAITALQTGRGDCTEYSVLAVALARSIGIHARVLGVQNMQNTPGEARYDNHNVAEFYVDGQWVVADVNMTGHIGELPRHILVMRAGLFTDRVPWYRYSTTSGPRGQLIVGQMRHEWREI